MINPVNGEKVPVWVADYIVSDYGTGAAVSYTHLDVYKRQARI